MGRVVIIGAGIAGLTVAETLRLKGYNGSIILVSDEASAPYDRPPLSKQVLQGESPPDDPLREASWYGNSRIDLVLNDAAVEIFESNVRFASGRVETFSQLVIATGARARRLDLIDKAGIDAHYLRTAADAWRLREDLYPGAKVAIVGAGVIGLEVAATSRALGAEVVVLEAADRPMARSLCESASEYVCERHRAAGIDLRFNVRIENVGSAGKGARIMLRDGSTIEADVVVVGVGSEPNIDLALAAGIQVENGIVVDPYGRTSRTDVYAVGDVACFPCSFSARTIRSEQWQHAVEHARATASAMLGEQSPYVHLPWFWSDQHDTSIQVTGRTDGDDHVLREDKGGVAFFHLDQGKLVGATTINLPRLRRPIATLVQARSVISPLLLENASVDLKSLIA